MGCLRVQIYTSTLAWYGRLGIRVPFYNMLQMARLEVQVILVIIKKYDLHLDGKV